MTVSGALGHSTVSTTSNIYCHMLEEAQAKVSDAVSSALDLSGKKKSRRVLEPWLKTPHFQNKEQSGFSL